MQRNKKEKNERERKRHESKSVKKRTQVEEAVEEAVRLREGCR